jgi:hypothetical protein
MIKTTYKGIAQLKEIKQLKAQLKSIEAILSGRGCYDVELYINYFHAYGFFKSPTGKTYYISVSDVRFNKLNNDILIREAKNNKDYQGGFNRYCKPTREALLSFMLS